MLAHNTSPLLPPPPPFANYNFVRTLLLHIFLLLHQLLLLFILLVHAYKYRQTYTEHFLNTQQLIVSMRILTVVLAVALPTLGVIRKASKILSDLLLLHYGNARQARASKIQILEEKDMRGKEKNGRNDEEDRMKIKSCGRGKHTERERESVCVCVWKK